MNERNFRFEAPPVPEHFIEARERTLNLIQCGEDYGAAPRRCLSRAAVLTAIAVLLLTVGAAAAVKKYGILDFLNEHKMNVSEGVQETFQTDLGSTGNDLYTASVDEAYFDGNSFMFVVRYEVNDPQETLFVKSISGNWDDDNGIYRRLMVWEIGSPDDPWQTLSEYENQRGSTRMQLAAVDPEIVAEDDVSWGCSTSSFLQPDGSLIHVIQGMISQPVDGEISVSVRCGAIDAAEEKPSGYEAIPITLTPSETVWQAECIPQSQGEGWSVESLRITSGRMLMWAEIEIICASGTLESDMDYWNIAVKDADGKEIPLMDGGGETAALPDGGYRCRLQASMLSPEGQPDALWLYLERDGVPPLGPIECRLTK